MTGENRDHRVTVNLTGGERLELQARADQAGVSLSTATRWHLTRSAPDRSTAVAAIIDYARAN